MSQPIGAKGTCTAEPTTSFPSVIQKSLRLFLLPNISMYRPASMKCVWQISSDIGFVALLRDSVGTRSAHSSRLRDLDGRNWQEELPQRDVNRILSTSLHPVSHLTVELKRWGSCVGVCHGVSLFLGSMCQVLHVGTTHTSTKHEIPVNSLYFAKIKVHGAILDY